MIKRPDQPLLQVVAHYTRLGAVQAPRSRSSATTVRAAISWNRHPARGATPEGNATTGGGALPGCDAPRQCRTRGRSPGQVMPHAGQGGGHGIPPPGGAAAAGLGPPPAPPAAVAPATARAARAASGV